MDHYHQHAHVFLSEELVIDILVWLPVESLVRFKIVCKNWCNVIDSSDFINKHFDHRSNHVRLLVYHCIPDCTDQFTLTIYPDETLSGQHPSHHHLDYLTMPNNLEYVIGPVRGLFLLCDFYTKMRPDNYRVALLNPASRECLPLFVPDSYQTPYFWSRLHHFGFGFDPLTGDFKVVALWYMDDRRIGDFIDHPLVAVYSLANGCWKHLGRYINTNQKYICFYSSTSTYANGSCYWLLDEKANSLLSFDMSGEVFQEIEGPQNPMSKKAHLVSQNDSLAVILYECSQSLLGSIDLLLMRQDGCWTKDLTFDGNLLPMWMLLGIWKNNDLLVRTSSHSLALYEPGTYQIRDLGIHGSDYISFDAFGYKESLVSLKGGNKEPEKYNISNIFQHFFNVSSRYLDQEDYCWCEVCMHDMSHCTCDNYWED